MTKSENEATTDAAGSGSDQDNVRPQKVLLKMVEEHVEAGYEQGGGDVSTASGNESSGSDDFNGKIINTRISEENKENKLIANRKLLLRGQSQVALPVQFE